jgi:peroxiredoxin
MASNLKSAGIGLSAFVPVSLMVANRRKRIAPWNYKQRRNLAIFFLHSAERQKCGELLREMAANYGEYQRLETEALAIAPDEIDRLRRLARELDLPFPVLADDAGKVRDRYLKLAGQSGAAVVVVDRWGAIFACQVSGPEHDLPAEAGIREWLEFIELQCEECFPSEWPTEIESEGETWDYPRSKIEAERVIRQECGKIPAVILRIAGAYYEDCHSILIAQQIARIYERRLESYLFPGNPDHGQAFVHLSDLVDCFQRVIEICHELGPREVFLIAEPDMVSYAELQNCLGDLIHGEDWPTIRRMRPTPTTFLPA